MATQQQKPESQVSGVIWAFMGLMIVGMFYAFWATAHTQIATGYSWVRVIEFSPFVVLQSWWTGAPGTLLFIGGAIGYWLNYRRKLMVVAMIVGGILSACGLIGWMFSGWFTFFLNSDKSKIEWAHIWQSTIIANVFTLLAFIVPIAVYSVRRSLATNPLNEKHFAKTKDYTLHSFTDEQGRHYPHLRLFRKLDLPSKSINEGKYRMADTEKQYAMKHDLLDRAAGKKNEFKVNRDRAAEIFRAQMGPLWSGYNNLSTWELAIMSLLLPRLAATDPKMSDADYKIALEGTTDKLIQQFWNNAADSYDAKTDAIKFDMKKAKQTVLKYKNSEKVKRFMVRHAYVNTIIYAMLAEARGLGVLAAADLRWLRVADRRLWLTVDNVGRITAFPEVSGIYSHFRHELKSKRAMERPMIDNAITALVRAIDGVAFSEDEVTEINVSMDAAEAAFVDATAKPAKMTVFLGARVVIDAKAKDIFDVAVISQTGDVMFKGQCKPALSAELIQAQFGLDNQGIDDLSTKPTSDSVRKKVLEVVNGHDLVVFSRGREIENFPGIDRSAATVVDALSEASDFDLSGAAVNEGVVEPRESKINSATDAALLIKLLWESERKRNLQAEAAALKSVASKG